MKARKIALMKFGIGNRAAFLTHTSVAERAICLESPIVFSAFDHILTRRRRRCGITLVGLRSVKLLAMVSRCGVTAVKQAAAIANPNPVVLLGIMTIASSDYTSYPALWRLSA